jgi:transposase
MTKYHTGIDLHKAVAQICVFDAEGGIVKERRWPIPDRSAGDALIAYLAQWAQEGRFAVEALGVNRWFVNDCQAAGYDILVVHAAQLDLKKCGKKTDKRDAREIARRLRLDDLHRNARSYYPSEEEYGRRQLLRFRHRQMKRHTQAVNRIRALLNTYLLRPPLATLTSRKNMAWLKEVELPTADATFVLRTLIQDLESLGAQLASLDKRIRTLAKEPDVAMLQRELPNVGTQTAAMLLYELGDVTRFEHTREVAAYAGVVPTVNQSGEGHAHHGRITKRGNRELRWTLSQWAVRLLASDPVAKAWSRRQRAGLTKNKRRLALARRLLVGVYVTLSRGEVFSLERCLGVRST